MRYLSLILLVILLLWSWTAVHQPSPISEWVHWGLQKELKKIIVNQIAIRFPHAKNIKFEKFWTENLKTNQVKASFRYSYEYDSMDASHIQGYAILQRELRESDLSWAVIKVHIFNDHIIFKDGITLGPSGN